MSFKFQSDSINTSSPFVDYVVYAPTFKFQSDSINTVNRYSGGGLMKSFKFQSDSINTTEGRKAMAEVKIL